MNHTRKGVGTKGGGASRRRRPRFSASCRRSLWVAASVAIPSRGIRSVAPSPKPPPGSGAPAGYGGRGFGSGRGGREAPGNRCAGPASGAREAGGRGYPRPARPAAAPPVRERQREASAATDLSPENRPCRGRRPSNLSHRSVGARAGSGKVEEMTTEKSIFMEEAEVGGVGSSRWEMG